MKLNILIGQPKFTNESETEPITLDEAKDYLKVDVTDDDDLISDLLTAARQDCEEYLNISLIERTVTATLQVDNGEMPLPMQPFKPNGDDAEDFISIKDSDDKDIATGNYKLYGGEYKFLSSWSNPRPANNFYSPDCWRVTVSYNAGYAADELPKKFKKAILKRLAELYEHRGDEAPIESDAFNSLKPYRRVV